MTEGRRLGFPRSRGPRYGSAGRRESRCVRWGAPLARTMAPFSFYRSLFIQARGVLKKELMQHLRSQRLIRRSRHARADGQSHGQIVDAISVRERPAEVEDRAIPGHWEGDLLAGTSNSQHRNFGGTTFTFCPLGQSAQQRQSDRRRRAEAADSQTQCVATVATKVQVYLSDPQSLGSAALTPRKTLVFETPADKLQARVASTH
jgi:hypothetical protein